MAERLKGIIPSYGQKLNDDLALTNRIRQWSSERLELQHIEAAPDVEMAGEPEPTPVTL